MSETAAFFVIMLKRFREFVMRGNAVDLAVAVVMGAAFGAAEY